MADLPSGAIWQIWIVGADHWPRALLRAELIERGYDAIGFVTLEDAALRLMREGARRPALLVLDRQDQVVDPAAAALLSQARVPILVVADMAHPGGGSLASVVETLQRPLTIGEIADAVDRLVASRARVAGAGIIDPPG